MDTETLIDTLQVVDALDHELSLQQTLEGVRDALSNLTSQPANPQLQTNLAQALNALTVSIYRLRQKVTPVLMHLISEAGGGRFFDPAVEEEIKNAIGTNAMTPSVARDLVTTLTNERATYLRNVTAIAQGLRNIGLNGRGALTGPAEIAFIVPRDLFKNHLGLLTKELEFINKLIRDFSEFIEGEPGQVELRGLSSSDPTIAIAAGLSVMYAIGKVTNQFLDAWAKVEKIREIRENVRNLGMTANLAEFSEHIKKTVNDVVEEAKKELAAQSMIEDGRKNELTVAVGKDLQKLFYKIERGLVIEIRVDAVSTDPDEIDLSNNDALSGLRTLSQTLQFPPMNPEAALLEAGDDPTETDSTGEGAKGPEPQKPRAPRKNKP